MNAHALRRVLRALIRGAHRLPLMRSLLTLALVSLDVRESSTVPTPFVLRHKPRQAGTDDLWWTGRAWSFDPSDALAFVSPAAAERHAMREIDPRHWTVARLPRPP